ncbi:hypothetical protein L1765_08735 [Microaerobacter geothermalis]|uniref:hypothetical protein n=1 Tax=Microaerobacter geothermalis TaxID=674972 RepID=UPI001F1826A7|nr:hypothetical protein [Microaerobacter geothermalis]MCF6094050.1 hypothetical protein [Microaerobacter geothermalis]
MQIGRSLLAGKTKPFSVVDRTLSERGFKKNGESMSPTYSLKITDVSTNITYQLRIPTKVISSSLSIESLEKQPVKIGQPSIESKGHVKKRISHFHIPHSIREAAEHKIAEIATYLDN